MTDNSDFERFLKLVPALPPVPEYAKEVYAKIAEKAKKGERVVFLKRPQRGAAYLIARLRRMGHSELEIAQLMSRTLYRK